MTALRASGPGFAASLRWTPEWPAALIAALAWVALAAGVGMPAAPPGHENHLHVHGSVAAQVPGWALMTLAMMLPVALPALRHVALNSIRRRRARAMAAFTVAYLAVWIAFGLVAIAGFRVVALTVMLGPRVLLVLALYFATAWQLTRTKRRAILACKRTVPLPPRGPRADVACARFGVVQALRCVRSCWAMMLVMVVAGHHSLIWMVALAPLVWFEELTAKGRERLRHVAAALGAITVLVALIPA
jgi:predicted metal-binding membrane protein